MATKKVKDLKKGDVIRTEFGCEGHWVVVTIQRVKVLSTGHLNCKLTCKTKDGESFDMYGRAYDEVELVERGNDERNRD